MESNRILYLFGAGASANALPTVAGINNTQFREDVKKLKRISEHNSIQEVLFFIEKLVKRIPNSPYRGNFEQFLKNLKYLSDSFDIHRNFTIDNICRYYSFENPQFYEKLKLATNQYFNFLELISPIDHRYNLFVMNLLSSEGKLPNNISILNWNYDRQLYNAFKSISSAQRIIPFSDLTKLGLNGFQEFKMNGIFEPLDLPNFYDYGTSNQFINTVSAKEINQEQIVKALDTKGNSIRFGWENRIDTNAYKEVFQSYNELIIIGYSFPFYNRSIDNSILRRMALRKKLKITIQDRDHDLISEKVKLILEDKDFTINTLDPQEFHIPESIKYD